METSKRSTANQMLDAYFAECDGFGAVSGVRDPSLAFVFAILLIATGVGCSTTDSSALLIGSFQIGITKKSDVEAVLGKADSEKMLAGGQELMLVYEANRPKSRYEQVQSRKPRMKTEGYTLTFDQNEILVRRGGFASSTIH